MNTASLYAVLLSSLLLTGRVLGEKQASLWGARDGNSPCQNGKGHETMIVQFSGVSDSEFYGASVLYKPGTRYRLFKLTH